MCNCICKRAYVAIKSAIASLATIQVKVYLQIDKKSNYGIVMTLEEILRNIRHLVFELVGLHAGNDFVYQGFIPPSGHNFVR